MNEGFFNIKDFYLKNHRAFYKIANSQHDGLNNVLLVYQTS